MNTTPAKPTLDDNTPIGYRVRWASGRVSELFATAADAETEREYTRLPCVVEAVFPLSEGD